jgi:oxygen-dependent protoporphyrinogen oxidase
LGGVLIIGGGITGLTAAYEVARRGGRPIVYEAAARTGGLIYTERADGFTIEAGPDSVLASKPAALDLVRRLGLESEVQGVRPPGGAFVLRDGALYRLPQPSFLGIPLSKPALDAYDLLPPAARQRMAAEPDVPRRTSGGDESVGAFFRRRFGPDTVDLIAQPLLGGIHAGDIERLSMRSLFPRLLDLEREHGSVMRAPIAASSAGPAGPAGFASLRGGMGSLVRALESALPPGTIRRGSPVTSLAGVRTGSEPVIVAAPAFAAARAIESLDPEAARLCAGVPYVSTASVALAWPRALVPHPLEGTGFVVARRHSAARITACTWVSSKWEGRAPEGTALVRAFIGGAHDPDAASLPEADLVQIVRRDLAAVIGVAAEPSLARVYRWPSAGAQHLVGHLDRVEEIDRRLRPYGVIVAGSGFRAVGIPDCIADARRAAAEATDG